MNNTAAKNVQQVRVAQERSENFYFLRFCMQFLTMKKNFFLFTGRRFLNQKAQFFNKISCYNPTICPVQTVFKNSSSGQRKCQTKFYVRVSAGEKKKSCLVFLSKFTQTNLSLHSTKIYRTTPRDQGIKQQKHPLKPQLFKSKTHHAATVQKKNTQTQLFLAFFAGEIENIQQVKHEKICVVLLILERL